MKKLMAFGLTALLISGLSACKKFAVNNTTDVSNTEETVNVSLNANQVFRYSLPAQANAGNVAVNSVAAKSSIAIVDSTGSSTFVYSPDQNFSGTDVVTITHPQHAEAGGSCGNHGEHHGEHHGENHGEHHGGGCGGGHQHSGNCGNGGDKTSGGGEHKIIFNITVQSAAK
jgi:hypothetical protein